MFEHDPDLVVLGTMEGDTWIEQLLIGWFSMCSILAVVLVVSGFSQPYRTSRTPHVTTEGLFMLIAVTAGALLLVITLLAQCDVEPGSSDLWL